MLKYRAAIFAFLMALVILTACQDQAKTHEEVFVEAHPNAEILHEIETEEGTVILYNEDHGFGAAQLSFRDGRWRVFSDNKITANGPNIVFNSSNLGSEKEILYGIINDQEIASIQVRKQNGEVIEATKLGTYNSYWYLQWQYDEAKLLGISKDGKVIHQSGFQ